MQEEGGHEEEGEEEGGKGEGKDEEGREGKEEVVEEEVVEEEVEEGEVCVFVCWGGKCTETGAFCGGRVWLWCLLFGECCFLSRYTYRNTLGTH